MKSKLLNLISALSILLLIAVSQSSAQTPQRDNRPRTASVSGVVTVGGAPAANALVTIAEADPQSRGWMFAVESPQGAFIKVRTDRDGRYRFAGLAEGDYVIRALSSVYVRSMRGSETDTYISVRLDEGESRDNVDFALVRGGVITGRVIDAEGRPLVESYLQLLAVDENGRPIRRFDINHDWKMRTDDRGVYRIYGLPAGRYILSAGGAWASIRENRKYPETFYPDATSQKQAKIIEVKAGAEVTGVDIRLGFEKNTYEVVGRVVDAESGQPLPQTELICWDAPDRENGGRRSGRPVATDTEGRFRVGELPPGRYELVFRPGRRIPGQSSTPMGNDEYYSEKTLFEVNDSDVSGLEVKAIRGSTVSGVVILEGAGDPAIMAKLREMAVSMEVFDDNPLRSSSFARIAADGGFRLTGAPPGRATSYLVGSQYGIFSIRRIEHDGEEIRSALEIRRGEHVTGIRIVVAHANGTVRGQVEMADGKLPEVGRFHISARPVGTAAGEGNRPAFQPYSMDAIADEKGRFVIEKLAPGEYELTLSLMAKVGQSEWSGSLDGGKVKPRVTVAAGAVTTVNLTFEPARK